MDSDTHFHIMGKLFNWVTELFSIFNVVTELQFTSNQSPNFNFISPGIHPANSGPNWLCGHRRIRVSLIETRQLAYLTCPRHLGAVTSAKGRRYVSIVLKGAAWVHSRERFTPSSSSSSFVRDDAFQPLARKWKRGIFSGGAMSVNWETHPDGKEAPEYYKCMFGNLNPIHFFLYCFWDLHCKCDVN